MAVHGASLCEMMQLGCHTDLDTYFDPLGRSGRAAHYGSSEVGLGTICSHCSGQMRKGRLQLAWRPVDLRPGYWPGNAQHVLIGRLRVGARRSGWCIQEVGDKDHNVSQGRWFTCKDVNASHFVDLEPEGIPTCGGSSNPFLVLTLGGSLEPPPGDQELRGPTDKRAVVHRTVELIERLLHHIDRTRFQRATGQPYHRMLQLLQQQSATDVANAFNTTTRMLTFGSLRQPWVLHKGGLTVLRKLVFERALIARRHVLLHRRPLLYPELLEDARAWELEGIRVLSPFSAHSWADRNRLLNLLRMITADRDFKLPCGRALVNGTSCGDPACCEGRSWLTRIDITHAPHDDQYSMHVDTLLPSIKMYIYPEGAAYTDGPFHYANGSHVASNELLRLLHEKSQFPARSFTRCPALRTDLRDERITELGYVHITPLVMSADAIVVADTSGLHRRGRAIPGIRRNSLNGRWWPLYSIPREHMLPFANRGERWW